MNLITEKNKTYKYSEKQKRMNKKYIEKLYEF